MKNLFIVALSLIILSIFSGNSIVEDRVFLLKNNTSILSSDILSIQNIVVSEYNKNFERYPPENRQLDSIFVLNQSFKSTIFLSYYGIIGFAFQESNIPAIRILYQNQSQDFNFLGFFGASKGANLSNVLLYNISVNNENYRYGFVTSNSYLTSNNLIDLANNYYLLDYALYLNENAIINQNEEVNLPVLQEAAKELTRIYQSGNKMEMAKATLSFYQLSNDLGVSDYSAKKILEDLKNKDSLILTPIIFTIILATIFLLVFAFSIVIFANLLLIFFK